MVCGILWLCQHKTVSVQAGIAAAKHQHLATCSSLAVCGGKRLYLLSLPVTGNVDDEGQLSSVAVSYQYNNNTNGWPAITYRFV